jgi:hypothetical protein
MLPTVRYLYFPKTPASSDGSLDAQHSITAGLRTGSVMRPKAGIEAWHF